LRYRYIGNVDDNVDDIGYTDARLTVTVMQRQRNTPITKTKVSIFDYSKNNENVTKITIYSVTSQGYGKLRKTYGKITEFKTKINK
jgi:hypothetical protein